MSSVDKSDFTKNYQAFSDLFKLENRLPDKVFVQKDGSKFVIGESGMFHRMAVFERLCEQYGDRKLYYLMIEPRIVSYCISIDQNLPKVWKKDLLGHGQENAEEPKVFPWMTANLQCYFGGSQSWCSYHDNYLFELDIFRVPIDCDVVRVFGMEPWRFSDFEDSVEMHSLRISDSEREKIRMNYFD